MSADLTTTYLGLPLRTPVVPSASPIGRDLDLLRRCEAAGAGAVVLPSLFEEEIEREDRELHRLLSAGADAFAESLSYFPPQSTYDTGPGAHLRHVEAAKAALTIPVIASLNGDTPGGWTRHAALLADAGADALELNVYTVAADPAVRGAEVEARIIELVTSVCDAVAVPVAVKLSPFLSSLAHLAVALEAVGAAGLVLFNRFVQPDIDLATLTVVDHVHLSHPEELLLPLRWTALLRPHVQGSIAVTTGVHEADAVVKSILAGADVVMAASSLLRHGPEHVEVLLEGLAGWLDENGYDSAARARGALSAGNAPDTAAYERAHYVHALRTYPIRSTPPA